MKAIPILVAVLAAATVNAAEAVEKRNNYPGITMKVSGRQRAPADGRAKASPPARAHGLIPFDPKVRVDGLADIVDGGSAIYEMWVTNEGTDPLVGPLNVDFDNSPAFATAVVDGQGWTCLSFFGVFCEWPGTLQPGQSTGRARFTIAVAPPYGNAAECDPERSPCVFLRANLGAYDADSVYSAVTVNGEVPPTAVDDAVVMAAVPVPSHFNILRNDMASPSFAFALIEAPQHGTLAIDPVTYQVLYTPGPAYPGTDTFRYRLTEPNGASDTAVVSIGELQGGISFDSALADIGNVEPGRAAMVLSWLENTTGLVLFGDHTVHAIDPAEFPAILAGTPYDPSQAVSDPSVFRQGGGFFVGSDFEPFFSLVRPNPPIGTVWLARQRLTLSPVNSPDITLQAEIVSVARSGAAGDVPVFVRDDAFSVPADQPSVVHPLANDASVAGNFLAPTAVSIFNPFEDDGEPWLEGTAGFIEQAPPFGAEYTPPPGFVGPTSFWYADSEIVAGNWIRYDWAKVSLTVGSLPPPPTAVASGSATICADTSAPLTGSGGVSCTWSPATGLDDASSCTPVASPASTTTYTLVVRDQHGQTSTNNPTVTVTVSPLPVAVAGGSATITLGQSTPLSGSGGVSCSWSPGIGLNNPGSCTPMASPVVTTTYALAVTNAAGCVSVNAATATITVVPAAPADLVTGVIIPLQGRAGQPIPVLFATLNIGAGNATASTTRFYLSRNATLDGSDVPFGTFAMPALAAGGVRVDLINPLIPTSANGNYYVIASADDGRVVFETNEANNTGTSPWRINIR